MWTSSSGPSLCTPYGPVIIFLVLTLYMVKAYQKFEQLASGGILASAEPNTVQFLDERRVLVAVNETVVGFHVKSGERIPGLLFTPTADQKNMADSILTVTAIAVSSQLLAVGYIDGSVRLFALASDDDETQASLQTVLTGHRSAVTSLSFTEEFLVSGSKDTDAVVWDLAGRCGLHRLRGHTGPVTAVTCLSGELVVTAGRDSLLKLWNLQTGLCLQSAVAGGLGEEVGSLVFLPEHRLLISGSTGTRMSVYVLAEANDTHPSLVFARYIDREVASGLVTALLYVASVGLLAAVCAGSRRVELWSVATAKKAKKGAKKEGDTSVEIGVKITKLPIFFAQAKVKSVGVWAVGASGVRMCLGLTDNRLEVASLDGTGKAETSQVIERQGHREGVVAGALTADESLLVTVDKMGAMRLWSAATEAGLLRCVRVLEVEGAKVTAVCWVRSDASNSHVLVGTSDGRLMLVNVHSGETVYSVELASNEAVLSVAFAGSNEAVVALTRRVVFVSLTRDRLTQVPEREIAIDEDERITCISFSAKYIAVGLSNNNVQLYFSDSLKPSLLLYGHSLPVLAMSFLNEELLATLSADKTLKIFSAKFGNIAKSIRLSLVPTSFAVVPDSRLVFVAGDGHVEQHDLDLGASDSLVWEVRNLHSGANRVLVSETDGGVLISLGAQDRGIAKFARTETQWFQDDLVESKTQKSIDSELANVSETVTFDRPTRKSHETVRRTEKLQQLLAEIEDDDAVKIGKLLCKIPSADLQEVLLGLSIAEGRKLLDNLIPFMDKLHNIFPIDVLLNVALTLVQAQGRYLLAEPEADILLQNFHAVLSRILARRKRESRKALAGAEFVAGQIARSKKL